MSRQSMMHILSEANEVEPLMTVNGTDVHTFQDAQKLNKADLVERKAEGKPVELGERKISSDGITYSRSNVRHAAVDPSVFFDNRYRKIVEEVPEKADDPDGKKKEIIRYEVVTDYRAIKEQGTGQVYTNNVIVLVIAKKGKDLVVEETKTIGADEFVNGFKGKLDAKSMIKILELTGKMESGGMKADKMEL